MNTLFNNNYGRKRGKYGRNIQKAMIIPGGIYQTKKRLFVTAEPKNVCELGFADHWWLPFLDQSQSDIIVFAIITFQIYTILVQKWKYGIGPNDIISFNE